MAIVYKYCTPDRTDILEDGLIRFTQMTALNDPFDSLPSIASLLEESFRRLSAKAKAEIGVTDDQIALNAQYSINDYIRRLSEEFVFLSLSSEPSDVTMWAHYADSHRGFLIGFDDNHEFFGPTERFKTGLRSMNYEKERFQMTAEMLRDQSIRTEAHDKVFFNKSPEWRYEQERRVISYPGKADRVKGQYSSNPIYLFRFPPDLVKEIRIGFRMSADKKKEVLALQQNKYPDAAVYQMHIDKYAYALKAIPYAQAVEDEATAKMINQKFVEALQKSTSDGRTEIV